MNGPITVAGAIMVTNAPALTLMKEGAVTADVITVIVDPNHVLGKRFSLNADGTVTKASAVAVSLAYATMHHVPDLEHLQQLLEEVSENSHAAIVNAGFHGIGIGENFIILSEREFEKRLGLRGREAQQGVHTIVIDGVTYKAVGRFKENVFPASYQYLDRDIDEHTPPEFASADYDQWLQMAGQVFEYLEDCDHLRANSTSARVIRDGVPVGGGNGHTWIKVKNAVDVERVRAAMLIRAAECGLTWLKPRRSTSTGKIVSHSLTTIFDTSVWTVGRLVFVGKPVVGKGLSITPQQFSFTKGLIDETVNTAALQLPGKEQIREITKRAGVEMAVSRGGAGVKISVYDLSFEMEVETQDHGTITVRDALGYLPAGGKLRCQTPFRESHSWAAFLTLGKDGAPCIHDVGTSTSHWLNREEWVTEEFKRDGFPVERVTEAITTSLPEAAADSLPYPPPFRGIMHDTVQAALAVSPMPQPDLCTLAALIGMAGACSGLYRLPSGMRLNLYGCGVAGTGEGKDLPRSIATILTKAAGGRLIGKPASGQGLEDALVDYTGTLIALDEVAHVFAAINASKAPPHLIELAANLLQLFSASKGEYFPRVKAQVKGTDPSRTVRNPVVNVLGFATPEKLGEAMSVSNIEDGLLGRFLIAFGASGVEPRRVKESFELPDSAAKLAEIFCQAIPAEALFAGNEIEGIPILIWATAEQRLQELQVEFYFRRQETQSAFGKALLARSCEKCERVAGVLAVWDNPRAPEIKLEHVAWAEQLLRASDAALLRFSGDYMHGGQTQADAQKVKLLIGRIQAGELKAKRKHEMAMIARRMAPYSMVLRASNMDKRRFSDAVAHLVDLSDVLSATDPSQHPNGRPETTRWLALCS